MGLREQVKRVGECAIRLMEFVGMKVLGSKSLLIKGGKSFENVRRQISTRTVSDTLPEVPFFLEGFFEARAAGKKEYVLFRAQISLLVFLVLSVFYILNVLSLVFYVGLGGITAIYLSYLVFGQVKIGFEEDYVAYKTLFLSYLGVIVVLVGIYKYFFMRFLFFRPVMRVGLFGMLIFALVFLVWSGFRKKYGRNYAFGVVVEAKKDKALVRVGSDLLSDVVSGRYFVDNDVGAGKGDEVKVSVKRSIISLWGNKPTQIIEIC